MIAHVTVLGTTQTKMTWRLRVLRKRWAGLLVASTLILGACSSDDDKSPDGGLKYTPADATGSGDSAQKDSTATCGPKELCTRSVNECAAKLTQQSCEGWYQDAANCVNMSAYTTCNCKCLTDATCDGYFACGEVCFNDHCK